MTLAQLRALLERAHGPAVERLTEDARMWGHVARAYLPHVVYGVNPITDARLLFWPSEVLTDAETRIRLDLTDPGTVNAVKVALALALGLDPGPMGCAVSWRYGAWGWVLRGADSSYMMSATIDEPDPIRALILAAEFVLCSPA
jgi:hypothetical protein